MMLILVLVTEDSNGLECMFRKLYWTMIARDAQVNYIAV